MLLIDPQVQVTRRKDLHFPIFIYIYNVDFTTFIQRYHDVGGLRCYNVVSIPSKSITITTLEQHQKYTVVITSHTQRCDNVI